MNTSSHLLIAIGLALAVAAMVVITIVSGSDSLAATGLRDLAILLGGALAGVSVPRGPQV